MKNKQVVTTIIMMMAFCGAHLFAAQTKPNIIFIMADDLGYGQLGCYGQEMIKTPRLDQMAAEGLRLTDYYAGTAVCAPSRCSLMTGRDVGHAYIRGNAGDPGKKGQRPLPAETITVAEKMKEAGYATAIIGKWGLGHASNEGDPLKQGFDFFFGYANQARAHEYYPGWVFKNDQQFQLGAKDTAEGYSHYAMTTEARGFIAENKSNPFFLYLAYTIPHAKLQIPASDEMLEQYADKDWPQNQKIHAAMISRLDADVGGLMDLLKELGIAENTLVAFTSDNGPHAEGGAKPKFFNDSGPLKGIKRHMTEGGVRVPFLAWWPGVVNPGQTSNHIAAHWDLMPTACELAGVASPETDGISYVPLLQGKSLARHKSVYFELHDPTRRGIRVGDWTAVQMATTAIDPDVDGKVELYNLKDDLEQQNDLARKYPEKLSEMKQLLKQAHQPNDYFYFGKPKPPKKKKK